MPRRHRPNFKPLKTSEKGATMADAWGYAIGGISNLAGSLVGSGLSKQAADDASGIAQKNYEEQVRANNLNFQMQQQNLDYQKALQKQLFEREDNATQRRAADLRSAGLSPVLAAGSAAGAGDQVAVNTPQIQAPQKDWGAGLQAKMQYAQMINQVGKSTAELGMMKAQIENIKAQTEKTRAETGIITDKEAGTLAQAKQNMSHTQQQTALSRVRELQESYDLNLQKVLGLPDGVDPLSPEGLYRLMNDPDVPAGAKLYFIGERGYDEIKDWAKMLLNSGGGNRQTYQKGGKK